MDRLKEQLLVAGLDDWLHLPDIAWAAKLAGAKTKEQAIETAASAVRSLVEGGFMQIGEVSDGGFFEWDLGIDEALRRMKEGWLALEHEPAPGDVCWLSNTEEGNKRATELLNARLGTEST